MRGNKSVGSCRLLEPAQHGVLAAALPDAPHTVQSIHMLRRGLCRAYVAGDPASFDGAILQSIDWPEEPTGFGSDPELLWKLLQWVKGWTCILVDSECAPALGKIIQAARGGQVRYLEDVAHVLTPENAIDAVGVIKERVLERRFSDPERKIPVTLPGQPTYQVSEGEIHGLYASYPEWGELLFKLEALCAMNAEHQSSEAMKIPTGLN